MIKRIFEVAAAKKNEVLILGAFGCVAFRNPTKIVARAFKKVMKDYLHCFDCIEFAVYHTKREIANYEAFFKDSWIIKLVKNLSIFFKKN